MNNLSTRLFLIIWVILLASCGGGSSGGSSSNTNQELVQEVPGLGTITFSSGTLTSTNGGTVSGSLTITSSSTDYNYSFMLQLPDALVSSGASITYTNVSNSSSLNTQVESDICTVTQDSPSCSFTFNPGNAANDSYYATTLYRNNQESTPSFNALDGESVLLVVDNNSSSSEVVPGSLTIVASSESMLIGDTTQVTLTLTDSENVTTAVVASIVSSESNIATVNPSSCNLTTLSNSCTITVTGESAGSVTINVNANGYNSVSTSSILVVEPTLVIFVTDASYNGNLGDRDGANAKCNSDINKPSTPTNATYKALLLFNGSTIAGKEYYRPDLTTLIAEATGEVLVENGTLDNAISDTSEVVWTGAGFSWCYTGPGNQPIIWTNDLSSVVGKTGDAAATNSTWYNNQNITCDTTAKLYCVQQP